MKFVLIPYIALGLVLALAVGVGYQCEGPEMFPSFYGSPFVFKQKSLASSMQYYYSISGLLLNVLIWSSLLFLAHKAVAKLVDKALHKKLIRISYKLLIVVLAAFATLAIAVEWVQLGRGFGKELNFWYWDINQQAENWGMTCRGELILFGSSLNR